MNRSNWTKQFTNSIKKNDDNYIFNQKYTDNNNILQKAAINVHSIIFQDKLLTQFKELLMYCESPAEEVMMYALSFISICNIHNVRFKTDSQTYGDTGTEPDSLEIQLQAKVAHFRVDFLLTYTELVPDFDNPLQSTDGSEPLSMIFSEKQIIIECCDCGNQPYQQISDHNKRDDEISQLGFPVYRYSHSDIWNDVIKCAKEAVEAVMHTDWNKKYEPLWFDKLEI